MTINSRIHALHLRRKDGSVTEIASFPRSGAFATHGRQPRRMGLAGLINYAASCRQVRGAWRRRGMGRVLQALSTTRPPLTALVAHLDTTRPVTHLNPPPCPSLQAPPPLRQAALAQYGYQFVEQVGGAGDI